MQFKINGFLSTSLWSIICNKNIIIPNLVFEGASYLGIILANNKPPLVLSASAAKRDKLACNQLKKRTCCS